MYKILLAEDERKIREGLKTILQHIIGGFHVAGEAINGREALQWLQTQVPDVLITDIRMPEIDGIELIRRTREIYPELIILIISGHSDFAYAHQAIKHNVFDYILKPIDQTEMALVMDKVKQELTERFGQHVPNNQEEVPQERESERLVIRQVKDIIARRLDQDISLQYIADQVHMNHRYLSALFKSETGQNFSDYVTEKRIEKAKQLLKDTRLNIESVAECCGYLNAKYFMSVFKQRTGHTPTTFRNEH